MMIPNREEVFHMTKEDDREIQRKLRVLEHAERTGQVAKTCRYFGLGRASFCRWRRAYERDGEDGLAKAKPIPRASPNQTPLEVEVCLSNCHGESFWPHPPTLRLLSGHFNAPAIEAAGRHRF